MKSTDLKNKTIDELNQEQVSLQKELFNLRMQRGMGQMQKTHSFRIIRQKIARIKTFIHEKKGS